jgi:three-Cys-motif partner protein
MMLRSTTRFGGDWTTEKLERIRKYLVAYSRIMSKQVYQYAYIDAFAGTGYHQPKPSRPSSELMIPELAERESQLFLEGSARIALQVVPPFHKYIFIEKGLNKIRRLQQLVEKEFPGKKKDVICMRGDANTRIQEYCEKSWSKHRAVMFLDPYGMQVSWGTVEAVAKTRAIDLWILFPLGVAVNRMLTRDGQISKQWRDRLDSMFGASDWYEAFYETKSTTSLFGQDDRTAKTADLGAIGRYYIRRLKTVFAAVAENPLSLFNSKNNPLYLLCFAAGNPKGAPTAVKIAQHILAT